MTYTFTEEEIKRFIDWGGVYDFELSFTVDDRKLFKKLVKATSKSFDEMTNYEKIEKFMIDSGYQLTLRVLATDIDNNAEYFVLRKEEKEEKLLKTDTDYTTAVKEIVNYFED